MELFISSGRHSFTDYESRIGEIEAELDSPEVVFIEAPTKSLNWTKHLVLFFYAPLLMAITHLWASVFLKTTKLFFGDDTKIEDYLSATYSVPKIPIDIPHSVLIDENRVLWAVTNWLAITWPFFGSIPNFPALSFTYLHILFFQGVVIFVTYLAAVHSYRNQYMANQIVTASDDFSQACFVTGGKHHDAIAQELLDHSSVDLLNSTK